jgi:hypothetical protein
VTFFEQFPALNCLWKKAIKACFCKIRNVTSQWEERSMPVSPNNTRRRGPGEGGTVGPKLKNCVLKIKNPKMKKFKTLN